jgi:AraC family transcriptional regulator
VRATPTTVWEALETVHAETKADVRLASPQNASVGIAISRFRLGQVDVTLPALGVPVFAVNYGEPFKLERTLSGRTTRGSVTPGRLAIMPPDAPTRWAFDKKGDSVFVYLSREVLDAAIDERTQRSAEIVPRFLIRDLVLERIADLLLKEVCEAGPDSALSADVLAQELAAHLASAHLSLVPTTTRRVHGIAPAQLRRAQEFMRGNLATPLTLQAIAGAAGVSPFHFARGFKQATGQPPHRYLRELRLSEARALLHDRRFTVGDVARAVGFTHSHFTAAYARRMGLTPARFRAVLWT